MEHDTSATKGWVLFAVAFLTLGPCLGLSVGLTVGQHQAAIGLLVGAALWLGVPAGLGYVYFRQSRRDFLASFTQYQAGDFKSWE